MFLVIGSTNVDLFIGGVEALPHWGGDEFAVGNLAWCKQPLHLSIGGNGANTAYVLGKLGAPVRLGSAIGDDLLGTIVAGWLDAAGVDRRWLRVRADAGTSTTTVVSDAAFHRLSFHHPGAYATFTLADLPAGWEQEVAVLLITGYPLLAQLRPNGCHELLARAKAAGALTALDIGPAVGAPPTLAELGPLLPHLDFLLSNEYELSMLAGEGRAQHAEQAAAVQAAGAGTFVLRQGKEGATVYTATEQVHAPAVPCTVRQTVGAGDAFNAGFLLALSQGLPLAAAAAAGNRTAAQVVSVDAGVLAFSGEGSGG